MKVNNLFLAGVAALSLGMTACNNEDIPQVNNPGEGTTFAGMYISAMKDVSTRAVNDKQEVSHHESQPHDRIYCSYAAADSVWWPFVLLCCY